MEITRQAEGETLVLTLKGRLDGAWSEHAGAALTCAIEEGWHQLRLDLGGVTFVSSAGIRVLVIHFKQLNKIGGRLAVIRPSAEARDVLKMAGLGMMIAEETRPAGPASPATPAAGAADSKKPGDAPRQLERAGLRCEIHVLDPGAALRVRVLGGEKPLSGAKEKEFITFPENRLGIGLGAFGKSAGDCDGRLGEFVALGGAALTQPADGTHAIDYMIAQGELVPELTAASGLVAEGGFGQLIRFDARDAEDGSVPLSELIKLVLELCGGRPAGFALAAETSALIGAALSAQPDAERGITFEFPEIRNRLVFTAEPAWPRSLSLAAGFVASSEEPPLAPLLRPCLPGSSGPWAHVHAAAFPYQPLPKGPLELGATVRRLVEEERALGLLHLLNDWRQPGGAGESRFYRGAIWLAPLELPAKL